RLGIALRAMPFGAVATGVLVLDVLDDKEAGRLMLQLLGDLLADAHALFAAAGASQRLAFELVLDGLTLQALGQRLPAVLVTAARATRGQLLPRLLLHRLRVHRHGVEHLPKQKKLRGVEALRAWPVEAAE